MNSVLEFMKKDHERLAELLNLYLDSKETDPSITLEYFTRFKDELGRHLDWEEKIFFPLLDNAVKGKNATNLDGFKREHGVLRDFIREIYLHLAAGDFAVSELDNSLKQFLHKHKEQEVKGLYILIDTTLDEETRHQAFKKLSKELYF